MDKVIEQVKERHKVAAEMLYDARNLTMEDTILVVEGLLGELIDKQTGTPPPLPARPRGITVAETTIAREASMGLMEEVRRLAAKENELQDVKRRIAEALLPLVHRDRVTVLARLMNDMDDAVSADPTLVDYAATLDVTPPTCPACNEQHPERSPQSTADPLLCAKAFLDRVRPEAAAYPEKVLRDLLVAGKDPDSFLDPNVTDEQIKRAVETPDALARSFDVPGTSVGSNVAGPPSADVASGQPPAAQDDLTPSNDGGSKRAPWKPREEVPLTGVKRSMTPKQALARAEIGYPGAPEPVVFVPAGTTEVIDVPEVGQVLGHDLGSRVLESGKTVDEALEEMKPTDRRAGCGTCGEKGHHAGKCPTMKRERCFKCKALYDVPVGHDPKTRPCPHCEKRTEDGTIRLHGGLKLGKEASAEYLSRKRIHESCMRPGEKSMGKSTQAAAPACERCGQPVIDAVLVQEPTRHKESVQHKPDGG